MRYLVMFLLFLTLFSSCVSIEPLNDGSRPAVLFADTSSCTSEYEISEFRKLDALKLAVSPLAVPQHKAFIKDTNSKSVQLFLWSADQVMQTGFFCKRIVNFDFDRVGHLKSIEFPDQQKWFENATESERSAIQRLESNCEAIPEPFRSRKFRNVTSIRTNEGFLLLTTSERDDFVGCKTYSLSEAISLNLEFERMKIKVTLVEDKVIFKEINQMENNG